MIFLLLLQADVAAEMKAKIGEGAVVEQADDLFYVGTDGSKAVVERGKRTLASMQRGLYKDFMKTKPDEPLKVYLFSGEESYGKFCRDHLGEEPSTPFGFYRSADRALVMNIATGYGTLAHEVVHPLAAADFPDIPSWLNEGFASLYEQSTSKDDGTIWGLVNWRLPGLQKSLDDVELSELMKTSSHEFYGRGSGLHYAAARYLCMYLQEQGHLPAFYKEFRDTCDKDGTGITQLEKVTGKKVAELQAEWKTWVGTLKFER